MFEEGYYTCQQLIVRHPDIVMWGWDDKKIGTFHGCCLVSGRRFGKNKRLKIIEDSFTELVKFAFHCRVADGLEMRLTDDVFVSYEEAIECFPEARLYNWIPTEMGKLGAAKLLYCKKCNLESKNLVSLKSVERLINYINNRYTSIANMRSA